MRYISKRSFAFSSIAAIGFVAIGFVVALNASALAQATVAVSNDTPEVVVELKNPEKYLRRQGPLPSAVEQAQLKEQYERARAASAPDQSSSRLNQLKPVVAESTGEGLERSQAIVSGNWTVIPNATPGALGNTSFIRLPNANTIATATYTVRLIGDDTGRDYGTAIVNVPPRASPQYSLQDLLYIAHGSSFDPADQNVSLYVRTSHYNTGFQHVYYNSNSDFFENMSVCSYKSGYNYLPLMSGVVNLHTQLLSSRFPSLITVHNENPFSTTIRARIHESQTGRYRGLLTFNAIGNSTYVFTPDDILNELGLYLGDQVFHFSLIFDSDPTNPPNALLSHVVTNNRVYGSVLNLTTICSIDD